MPIRTMWLMRRAELALQQQKLRDDLARRQVARQPLRPGRAERAGHRAARLRGQADRNALRVRQQDALDGVIAPASVGPESSLVPSCVSVCASLAVSGDRANRSASVFRAASGRSVMRAKSARAPPPCSGSILRYSHSATWRPGTRAAPSPRSPPPGVPPSSGQSNSQMSVLPP